MRLTTAPPVNLAPINYASVGAGFPRPTSRGGGICPLRPLPAVFPFFFQQGIEACIFVFGRSIGIADK